VNAHAVNPATLNSLGWGTTWRKPGAVACCPGGAGVTVADLGAAGVAA
jgi:hypothetical protein